MSEPVGPAEPGTETGKVPGAVGPGGRRTTVGRWVRGRTARWVGVGAAVVVLGGVAAVAVHHVEEHHGSRVAFREGEPVGPVGGKQRIVRGEDGRRIVIEQRTAGRPAVGDPAEAGPSDGRAIPHLAPAPLPELAAGDAVAKAAAAVPGGKVESLRPADRQGGGRSWQAVVVGTDGVRHLVTVDGTSGAVTGNSVVDGPTG
ncbi:hypothetical protein AB0442_17380 [Kitasatospora sp. NPDC085895]|uniref:hypothetical protein n=1 Tax=Kitasatospora sp. NPDC085895 TaxID=3155057 RepID=UPI00344F2702